MNYEHHLLATGLWGRFQCGDLSLAPGTPLDLRVDRFWISGKVEFVIDTYVWVSAEDRIHIPLERGMLARVLQSKKLEAQNRN